MNKSVAELVNLDATTRQSIIHIWLLLSESMQRLKSGRTPKQSITQIHHRMCNNILKLATSIEDLKLFATYRNKPLDIGIRSSNDLKHYDSLIGQNPIPDKIEIRLNHSLVPILNTILSDNKVVKTRYVMTLINPNGTLYKYLSNYTKLKYPIPAQLKDLTTISDILTSIKEESETLSNK